MKFNPKEETIVTAWAEKCHGPGWSNIVVWILVRRSHSGALRTACLQPHEQTPELRALIDVSDAVTQTMTAFVKSLLT